MAWIREDTVPRPISDQTLIEELSAGEIAFDAEVRHPVWTENRFQPVREVPQLQDALADPRALLAERLRRPPFPWGTIGVVGLALVLNVTGPPWTGQQILDLVADMRIPTHFFSLHALVPLFAIVALPAMVLARFERAFGLTTVLTATLLVSPLLMAPMWASARMEGVVLPAPPFMMPALFLSLFAAVGVVAHRHRRWLPWNKRGTVGIWLGFPALLVLPIVYDDTMLLLGVMFCYAVVGGLAAWMPPLSMLLGLRRERHQRNHLAVHSTTFAICVAALFFVAHHPEMFVQWYTTPLPPSGITIEVPAFGQREPYRQRPRTVVITRRWGFIDEIALQVSLSTVGENAPKGLAVMNEEGAFRQHVICDPFESTWRSRLCDSIFERVTFKKPYTEADVMSIRSAWRLKYETRYAFAAEALMIADAGDQEVAQRLSDLHFAEDFAFYDANSLAQLWRRYPEIRPVDYRDKMLRAFGTMTNSMSDSVRRSDLAFLLREEPCNVLWFRSIWSFAWINTFNVLQALDCPTVAPTEIPFATLEEIEPEHLERTLDAIMVDELVWEPAQTIEALTKHYLHFRGCDELKAGLQDRLPEEMVQKRLRRTPCAQ